MQEQRASVLSKMPESLLESYMPLAKTRHKKPGSLLARLPEENGAQENSFGHRVNT